MKEKNIAAFQAAVAKDGKIIFEEAFGIANREEEIMTTINTKFKIGSIQKTFVSTALMILNEKGQLDLHDPVNHYLTHDSLISCNGSAADATIARMLLHVSGLADGYYISSDDIPPEDRRSLSDILELSGIFVYPPGTIYEYTNTGYGILDEILDEVSGTIHQEFIMEKIVAPLGLKNTGFYKLAPPVDEVATENVGEETVPFHVNADGYTGMYSTAGDLVRYGMFHLKNRPDDQPAILADSSIDLLLTYQEPGIDFTSRTLAWDVQEDYGLSVAMHGGGGPGIHNYLYLIPSENVAIAYVSNAQYWSSENVLQELIAAALPGSKKIKRRKGQGWPRWQQVNRTLLQGNWKGEISGPIGSCHISVIFNNQDIPMIQIDGSECRDSDWTVPSRQVQNKYGKIVYRFDECIPYLLPFAAHDEVILNLVPDGDRLIGSASAAREKNFGMGENYVLPQCIILERSGD